MPVSGSHTAYGLWLLIVSSAVGVAVSVFNYFADIGIGGTAGALLVVVSTTLILAASLAILPRSIAGWVHVALEALILLGILGTGFAAYLLEAYLLVGLMALAFVGWLVQLTRSRQATEAGPVWNNTNPGSVQ